MKKVLFLVAGMAAFVACQPKQVEPEPDAVDRIVGNYSYKISGEAEIDSVSVRLADEIGALEIVRVDSVNALVTFNELAGSAYYTYLEVGEKELKLKPYERILSVKLNNYAISVSGKGVVYDNTIVFDLSYTMQHPDTINQLSAEKLTLLCKKN